MGAVAHKDLLALFDQDQRRDIEYPGMRREALSHLVRHVDLSGREGTVLYSRLSEDTVEEAIREQIAYFSALGQDFEWKVFSHDEPPDLTARLASHGFMLDETEAVLVLDTEVTDGLLAPASDVPVRRITDPDHLKGILPIKMAVWDTDEDHTWLIDALAAELRDAPDRLSIYVAYTEGVAAACAWVRFAPRSVFASLWGGSTMPAYRNRGLYTALLAARAREARERGVRFLTVDAGPMSRPILEKRGFRLVTCATACRWHPSQKLHSP